MSIKEDKLNRMDRVEISEDELDNVTGGFGINIEDRYINRRVKIRKTGQCGTVERWMRAGFGAKQYTVRLDDGTLKNFHAIEMKLL